MQTPELGQVKHTCQMTLFLGGCKRGVANSGLPYRGLYFGAVDPKRGVLKCPLQTNGCFQPSFLWSLFVYFYSGENTMLLL